VRRNNEDGFLALEHYGVFAVADGMGGHAAGEIASASALMTLERFAEELSLAPKSEILSVLTRVFNEANRQIIESAQTPETDGMGTTLTALVLRDDFAAIGHIGDSRVYLWRNGMLTPLTDDHSLVQELVRLGQVTEEEAKTHPQRHVLVRALGVDPVIEIDRKMVDVSKGDVFLLCTDGFSSVLDNEEISREFRAQASWEARLENLKQLVFERGAPDNFTVLCCVVE